MTVYGSWAGVAEWYTAPCLLRAALTVVGLSHGLARTSTNARGHVCKYVDQKGSVVMLTSKQQSGVAPEVNLGITQAGKNASKGSTLALNPRAYITRSPKQRHQWPYKKDSCPPKILKKDSYGTYLESDIPPGLLINSSWCNTASSQGISRNVRIFRVHSSGCKTNRS